MTLYQEIRAAGKSMHAKALEAARHPDFLPARIAKRMTLPTSGRTLIFDGGVAQSAFFDFWFQGFSFGFEPERVPGILDAHRQRMKKVPPAGASEARFVFFFQKHRQLGMDQEYRDVN